MHIAVLARAPYVNYYPTQSNHFLRRLTNVRISFSNPNTVLLSKTSGITQYTEFHLAISTRACLPIQWSYKRFLIATPGVGIIPISVHITNEWMLRMRTCRTVQPFRFVLYSFRRLHSPYYIWVVRGLVFWAVYSDSHIVGHYTRFCRSV